MYDPSPFFFLNSLLSQLVMVVSLPDGSERVKEGKKGKGIPKSSIVGCDFEWMYSRLRVEIKLVQAAMSLQLSNNMTFCHNLNVINGFRIKLPRYPESSQNKRTI